MTRKLRIWYPGASYHIMCRGNHQHDIFLDNEDREYFLSTLRYVQKLFPYQLHSYCLMTNHVHLQIETLDQDISQIMQRINMLYTIYFNKKYDCIGHLFQGRFRDELIDTEIYQIELSKYIHLNPVRANMVSSPQAYPWSSYHCYVEGKESLLVTTEKILHYFTSPRVERYRQYVED